MSLFITISDDLKESMKAKDSFRLSVLRMLISAVQNKKIELKSQEELNDEDILAVIKSEVKKRKDSFVSYVNANRDDLAKIEKDEIEILEKYLPDQISDKELEKIIKKVISVIQCPSMKNFGQIMGTSMKEVNGQADGDRVSVMVKKILSV